MKSRLRIALTAMAFGGIAGCATYPTGPSVMALPGTNACFDQFQADDLSCRSYAGLQSGVTPGQTAADSGVNSAAVGTMVGAAAGALLGAASGNAAAGAALGAGGGLLIGSASGTEAYSSSGDSAQTRMDGAYIQCMYAKGHQVPLPAGTVPRVQTPPPAPYYAPAPQGAVAPPVQGAPGAPSYPPQGTKPPPGY